MIVTSLLVIGPGAASAESVPFSFPTSYHQPAVPANVGVKGSAGLPVPVSSIGPRVTNGAIAFSWPATQPASTTLSGTVYNGTTSATANDVAIAAYNATTAAWASAQTGSAGTYSLTLPRGNWEIYVNGTTSYIGVLRRIDPTASSFTLNLVRLPFSDQSSAVSNLPAGTQSTQTTVIGPYGPQPEIEVQLVNESPTPHTILANTWTGTYGTANFTALSASYTYGIQIDGYSMNLSSDASRYWYTNQSFTLAAISSNPSTTVYLAGYNSVLTAGTQQGGLSGYSTPTTGSFAFTLAATTEPVWINGTVQIISGAAGLSATGIPSLAYTVSDNGGTGLHNRHIYFEDDTFFLNGTWGYFGYVDSSGNPSSGYIPSSWTFINDLFVVETPAYSPFVGAGQYTNLTMQNCEIIGATTNGPASYAPEPAVNNAWINSTYVKSLVSPNGGQLLAQAVFYSQNSTFAGNQIITSASIAGALYANGMGNWRYFHGFSAIGGAVFKSDNISSSDFTLGGVVTMSNTSAANSVIILGTDLSGQFGWANDSRFRYDNFSADSSFNTWGGAVIQAGLVLGATSHTDVNDTMYYLSELTTGTVDGYVSSQYLWRDTNNTWNDDYFHDGLHAGGIFFVSDYSIVENSTIWGNYSYSTLISLDYTSFPGCSSDQHFEHSIYSHDAFVGCVGNELQVADPYVLLTNDSFTSEDYPSQMLSFMSPLGHDSMYDCSMTDLTLNLTWDEMALGPGHGGSGGVVYIYAPGPFNGGNLTISHTYFGPLPNAPPYEHSATGYPDTTLEAFAQYVDVFDNAKWGGNITSNYFSAAFAWSNQTATGVSDGTWNFEAFPLYLGSEGHKQVAGYNITGNTFPGAYTPGTALFFGVLYAGTSWGATAIGDNTLGYLVPGSYFAIATDNLGGLSVAQSIGTAGGISSFVGYLTGTFNGYAFSVWGSTQWSLWYGTPFAYPGESPLLVTPNGYYMGTGENFTWNGYNYSASVEPTSIEIGVNSTRAPRLTVAFSGLNVGEAYALEEYNSSSGALINGPANHYVYPTSQGWVNTTYDPATMPTDPTVFVLDPTNSLGAIAGGTGSFVLLLATAGGVILLGTAFGAYLMATNRREDGP